MNNTAAATHPVTVFAFDAASGEERLFRYTTLTEACADLINNRADAISIEVNGLVIANADSCDDAIAQVDDYLNDTQES